MRIAILGGGIAGLAAAIHLRQLGWDPVVHERDVQRVRHGHGFILLAEGLAVLDAFGFAGTWRDHGERIERFVLRRPEGTDLHEEPMVGAYGFRRSAFVELLDHALPTDALRMGQRVQSVAYEPGTRRVRSVALADGTSLQADLYIDAVGKESAVRAALHPGAVFGPVLVREMVSHAVAPDMADILATRFLKYQDPAGGLAVGLVPCGQGRLLWYVQFDAKRHPFTGTTGAETKILTHHQPAHTQALQQQLLNELLRRECGKGARKALHMHALDAGFGQQLQFFAQCRQARRCRLGREQLARMRLEGQQRRTEAACLRLGPDTRQDGLMTDMHAIEIAHRKRYGRQCDGRLAAGNQHG